jgi:ABC-type sulfate transport system substrate-binding protein
MKNLKLILFTLILTFVSCGDQGFLTNDLTTDTDVMVKNYKVITIDSCEYITYDYSAGYSGYGYLAHKGNCKNSYHKDNQ